jgi:Flp pilus assembly protein TadB
MNPLMWLNPGRWLAVLALAGALALAYFGWRGQQREIGRQEVRRELAAAAEAQTARNRELQRASEKRYTVQAQARERFFVTTVKEIRHAAAPLAACPVPADAIRLLNDAAAGARGDSAAACGAGDSVPGAR